MIMFLKNFQEMLPYRWEEMNINRCCWVLIGKFDKHKLISYIPWNEVNDREELLYELLDINVL